MAACLICSPVSGLVQGCLDHLSTQTAKTLRFGPQLDQKSKFQTPTPSKFLEQMLAEPYAELDWQTLPDSDFWKPFENQSYVS